MADRNQLAQEKAGLVKQVEEIVADYNKQSAELLKDLNTTTQASIDPLNKRIQEINAEILSSVDQEAGLGGEACPA
jgi:hypothetical protein|tara:strand:- start:323 stop:550 length:228 start_codon:yes stop_codon:yes gene_type:complete